ncbi:unnamed protein product [Clonostachys solani]|uniref:Uncharacterized protein n=1 Tax=Clonostachys solani TaxID=160281 RepID=A0A9N9W459_9HYPO|nr:unnamed protein product [Clonostachys solani]
MSSFQPNTYAANTVLAIGLVPGLVGINALLRPGHALSLMGFPSPPEAGGRKLSHSLVQMMASRNISMSLTTITLWFVADQETLGYLMLAQAPIALIDGFISRWQVEGMEWGHWIAVPISVGLGARLVGWI